MNNTGEIQEYIYTKCGLKTSVKKGVGSMKGYCIITPIFQGGSYPNFPFEFTRELRLLLDKYDTVRAPVFCNTSQICVYNIEDVRIQYKKESKPKPSDKQRKWGSKNSQLRLDKATARYANKLRKGGCARYC
jgi:hypothetical protein